MLEGDPVIFVEQNDNFDEEKNENESNVRTSNYQLKTMYGMYFQDMNNGYFVYNDTSKD